MLSNKTLPLAILEKAQKRNIVVAEISEEDEQVYVKVYRKKVLADFIAVSAMDVIKV